MSEWIGDECDPQAIAVDTPTSFSPPCTLDGKLAKNQPAASTRQACRKDTINSTNVIDVLADVKGPARTEPNEMLVFEWSRLRPDHSRPSLPVSSL